MRPAAVIEVQILADRGPGLRHAVVGLQVGEWREAFQPRALPEPDVNLSIHPAPVISPLIPTPNPGFAVTGQTC